MTDINNIIIIGVVHRFIINGHHMCLGLFLIVFIILMINGGITGASTYTFTRKLEKKAVFTFHAELKAKVAEGQGPSLRLQFADAADVVIVQVDVLKLLLFLHPGPEQNTKVRDAFLPTGGGVHPTLAHNETTFKPVGLEINYCKRWLSRGQRP